MASGGKKRILLIDQNESSRLFVRDVLVENYDLYDAYDGFKALALARRHEFDLILLDTDLEEGEPFDICSQLKEHAATKYLPLILLSSYEQKEDIVKGLNAGAEDYMAKPLNETELLARIDAHLRTKGYYSDLEKSDLLMLIELTEIISVTRNPRKILSIIVEKMYEAIDVSRCSIIAIDDEGALVVKASTDLDSGKEISIDIDKYPEIQKALSTLRPVVVDDVASDPMMEPVRSEVKDIADKTIFVVPIVKKQNVIGTFFLRTSTSLQEGITDRVYKLCQIAANITGNALENAMLFESMQETKKVLENLALRDSLTKLFNHQYFHTRLEEEFFRAQRYGMNLSCLFIDLDNFKIINDCFGHITGDVVLKQVGRLMRQHLRKSDVAARYGGEEFTIIMPNTGSAGALEVAERILTEVRNIGLYQLEGMKVTVSVGVATYQNRNFSDYEEMIRYADQAMYRAKREGKDRVSLEA